MTAVDGSHGSPKNPPAGSPVSYRRAPEDPAGSEQRQSEITPVESGSPDVGLYGKAAGGLDAIRSTLGYVIRESGLVRGAKVLLKVNQEDGFDCPSCAWPDPEHRATFEFCENGARAVADEATRRRVTPAFFAEHSIESLLRRSDAWLNAQGRLTHPMVRRKGASHYEPISWHEAFSLLGNTLRGLRDPNRAIFYTSGRTSNEAAFLYQLFVRQFGTNNMPDCSNMCHESSGTGLTEVIGIGKGTVLLQDFERAEAIFVIGQNPGTNHPRMLTALRDAKVRGCKIVTINPIKEPGLIRFKHPQRISDLATDGVKLSDLYLQVRVGGDVALLKGIMKAMLDREHERPESAFDHDFIAVHTRGYKELITDLERTTWRQIVEGSGVPKDQIEAAAAIAIESRATIACWAMGITQHEHGVANVQSIVNFLLLRGMMGKPGAGACPVRGHSNVQGDRTVGVWEKVPPWIDRLAEVFEFTPPRETGLDTVGAIEAMYDGRTDVFFGLGGNFLSATPDTDYVARALRRTELTAHVSTKLNRAHLVTGEQALILPCLGRTERDAQRGEPQFVTVENSMGIVTRSQGRLAPASEHLLSEPQIVARLARAALGRNTTVDWEGLGADYDRIRDAIAEVVPGFDNYNARVRHHGGFVLPNGPRDRKFNTKGGKAHFTVHPIPRLTLPADHLWMTTVRSHDQFNTTIYDLDDRYRGVYNHRRVVLMNAADIETRGLHAGDKVTLTSHFRGQTRSAPGWTVVEFDLPAGNVATYFPEANVLVPVGSYAKRSRTPTSKAVPVTIAK